MLYKIADLLVNVPEVGDLNSRCRGYIWQEEGSADIVIRTELFHPEHWPNASEELMYYMASGTLFHANLLNFSGLMIHSSAVVVDGRAYLFSGPSGMGKSTHTRLWQELFGQEVQVINDDKPAVRRLEDGWYAYGTPWCGKDGINLNQKAVLAGICFLQQGDRNEIRQLSSREALQRVLGQTLHKFYKADKLDLVLNLVEKLIQEVPIYELINRPELDAARLSYEVMSRKARS